MDRKKLMAAYATRNKRQFASLLALMVILGIMLIILIVILVKITYFPWHMYKPQPPDPIYPEPNPERQIVDPVSQQDDNQQSATETRELEQQQQQDTVSAQILDKCYQFPCHDPDASVFSLIERCDGFDACPNGFDEIGCEQFERSPNLKCGGTHFTCYIDRKQIEYWRLCDGNRDCSDNQDEQNCSPPEVRRSPNYEINVREGDPISLQCKVRGHPMPLVQWRFRAIDSHEEICHPLPFPDHIYNGQQSYTVNGTSRVSTWYTSGETACLVNFWFYVLENAQIADSGEYSCQAHAWFGNSDLHSFKVTVHPRQ